MGLNIQGRAKVGLQLWVHETQRLFLYYYVFNWCVFFHMNDCKPISSHCCIWHHAPGFLGWKEIYESFLRRQTAEKASVPSLLHPEGLLHIFLWSSDPRLVSKGNEQMGLNDLKAAVCCLFNKATERLEVRAGTEAQPLPEYNTQQSRGTQSPPREVGSPVCVPAQLS